MSSEDFKTIVKEYANISKEITAANKAVKLLKDQKDQLGASILAFMQSKNVDECMLPGGGKITRKVSKRTGTLKPEIIFEELVSQLGDEAKAQQALQSINSKRGVTEREVISLTQPRGGAISVQVDDDE
jgi:cell division protein FtsB